MNEPLYVPTDSNGVEHASSGRILWQLPGDGHPVVTDHGHPLTLRQVGPLLDVLDERIYHAEPTADVHPGADGNVLVAAARLTGLTGWNTGSAAEFGLDCAEHVMLAAGDPSLPDGTPLRSIIADARSVLDGVATERPERLGYLARLRALRRLHRERDEVEGHALALLLDDEARDLDALDDPDYASVVPITDSLLAAIEALRHHVLPQSYLELTDARAEREEHRHLDGKGQLTVPAPVVTPFGAAMEGGGGHLLAYEPAWTSARDAARHARSASQDRAGAAGEASERSWQAARLALLLEKAT